MEKIAQVRRDAPKKKVIATNAFRALKKVAPSMTEEYPTWFWSAVLQRILKSLGGWMEEIRWYQIVCGRGQYPWIRRAQKCGGYRAGAFLYGRLRMIIKRPSIFIYTNRTRPGFP